MEEIKQEFSERTKLNLKRILLGYTYVNSVIVFLVILGFLLAGISDDRFPSIILLMLPMFYLFVSPLFFLAFIIIFTKYRKCEFYFNQGILILCNSAFFIITTLCLVYAIILGNKYSS
jgi:hypothetical protein